MPTVNYGRTGAIAQAAQMPVPVGNSSSQSGGGGDVITHYNTRGAPESDSTNDSGRGRDGGSVVVLGRGERAVTSDSKPAKATRGRDSPDHQIPYWTIFCPYKRCPTDGTEKYRYTLVDNTGKNDSEFEEYKGKTKINTLWILSVLALLGAGIALVNYFALEAPIPPEAIIIIGVLFTLGSAFVMVTRGEKTKWRPCLAFATGAFATSAAYIGVEAANAQGTATDLIVAHAWLQFAALFCGTILVFFLAFYVNKRIFPKNVHEDRKGVIFGGLLVALGIGCFAAEHFMTALDTTMLKPESLVDSTVTKIPEYDFAFALMIALGVMMCAFWIGNQTSSRLGHLGLGAVCLTTACCIIGVGIQTFGEASSDVAHIFTLWGGAGTGFVIALMLMGTAISYCLEKKDKIGGAVNYGHNA